MALFSGLFGYVGWVFWLAAIALLGRAFTGTTTT